MNNQLSLYRIFYVVKGNHKCPDPLADAFEFDTEEEYQHWLTNSYATAKQTYDVKIAKRNDGPKEFYPYIDIHPEDV